MANNCARVRFAHRDSKNSFGKVPRVLVGTVVFLVIGILNSPLHHQNQQHAAQILAPSALVARVNGAPIVYGEFKLQLDLNRAEIFNYFKQKYNANDSHSFWTTRFGGETPIGRLKREALNAIIQIKIQEILARQEHLIGNISYSALMKNWATTNQWREKAQNNHQVLYGPIQYSASNYYQYILGNLFIHLQNKVIKQHSPTFIELNKFYEAHKQNYHSSGTIRLEEMALSLRGKNQSAVMADISQTKAWIKKGETFQQIAAKYHVHAATMILTETSLVPLELIETANSLKTGQTSSPFAMGNMMYLVHCLSKVSPIYYHLTAVKGEVEQQYNQHYYQQMIDRLVRHAKVTINHVIYNQIQSD